MVDADPAIFGDPGNENANPDDGDRIKQGAWIVEELIALDTDRTFVALK